LLSIRIVILIGDMNKHPANEVTEEAKHEATKKKETTHFVFTL